MAEGDLYLVRLEAPSIEDLLRLIDELGADDGCRTVARATGDGYTVDVYVTEGDLAAATERAATRRAQVEVLENSSSIGRERQAEVQAGNRYASRGEIPRGLGVKE